MKSANGTTREFADQRSIGQLLRDLRDDGLRLLRQELQLFGVEIREGAKSAGRNGLLLLIGAVVLFFAALAMIVTACVGLSMLLMQVMPLPGALVLGPLIVGVLLAGGGWMMVHQGFSRLKNAELWPQRSLDELKETRQWLSDNTRN